MKKIIILVILMVLLFMSCAMEPSMEDLVISGYDGKTLYTESIQLTTNVPVTWSDNAPNGLVTANGPGEIIVTATDYDGYIEEMTITFEDFRLVGEWISGDGKKTFDVRSDGTYTGWTDAWGPFAQEKTVDGVWYTNTSIYFVENEDDIGPDYDSFETFNIVFDKL